MSRIIVRSRALAALMSSATLVAMGCAPGAAPPAADVRPDQKAIETAGLVAKGGAAAKTDETRLSGVALLNDKPLAGAKIKAIDLATGKALPLVAAGGGNLVAAGDGNLVAAGGGNLVAAGGGNYELLQDAAKATPGPAASPGTNGDGRFDLALPKLAAGQVVKVVAERDGVTLVSFFDSQGRTLLPDALAPEAAGGQGQAKAGYSLTQDATLVLNVRMKLTAGTSAAAKSFEGALKLRFQLSEDVREDRLGEALAAAQTVVDNLEKQFEQNPELAEMLAGALDDAGEIEDLDTFQDVLNGLGATDDLSGVLQDLLVEYVREERGGDVESASLDAITNEDFPVGKVEIAVTGEFTFETAGGETISGSFDTSTFAPKEPTGDKPSGDGTEPNPGTETKPDTNTDAQPGTSTGPGTTTSEESSSSQDETPPFGDARGGLDIQDGTITDPTATEGIEN